MKGLRLIVLMLTLGTVLSACDFDKQEVLSGDEVSIAYAEAISSYSPIDFEAKNRKYLANIYETLVRYDKSFNYDTGLSISWGRSDDYTWEFKLREGVVFHDGTSFDADDAVYSIELARSDENSQLVSLLSTIESVEKIDANKIEITTYEPDPLLLNKLTSVYILPAAYDNFINPLGTGPYYISGFENNTLKLKRSPIYWGSMPYYENVNLVYIPDVEERLNAILSHDVNVLANVPPQFVPDLRNAGISLEVFPSLEVSYLMMNFEGQLSDTNLRNAVWYALSNNYAEILGEGFLIQTDQYAALGIFGYVSDIEERKKNLDLALEYRSKYKGDVTLNMYVPMGLEALGEIIARDLNAVNIDVLVHSLTVEDFEPQILSGDSDLYFFGWKFDLADVSDFYETVLHSNDGQYGEFNGINYSNYIVDDLIEEASQVLDVQERREILGQILAILVEDRVSLPLFEAQVIYGIAPEVHWSVRLDGQILASEIRENVLQ